MNTITIPIVLFLAGNVIHSVGLVIAIASRAGPWELWVHLSMLAVNSAALLLLLRNNRFAFLFGGGILAIFVASQPIYFLLGFDNLTFENCIAMILATCGAFILFRKHFRAKSQSRPVGG